MKNLVLFFLLSVTLSISAQGVKFIDNDWNKARAEAKASGKYLFVDAYTDWCSWCKVMDRETFPNADVVQMLNSNFVSLKLEMEHNYGVNVAMKYRVSGFPTFLIFTAEGKLVRKIPGYLPAENFVQELKLSLNTAEYPPLSAISEMVDLVFPEFYKASFAGKGKRVNSDAPTVNSFLDTQKDLFSEVSFSVLTRFGSLLNDKYRNFLFNNQSKYETLYGTAEIQDVVNSLQYKMLNNAVKNKSEKELENTIVFAQTKNKQADDITPIWIRINYYKGTEEWGKMAEQVDKYIAIKGHPSNNLNDWSWNVYENCNDQEVIRKAVGWMFAVTEAKAEYATMDTYAALLYKAGHYREAQAYAEKAIDLGKAEGQKTTETENLMKKILEAMK